MTSNFLSHRDHYQEKTKKNLFSKVKISNFNKPRGNDNLLGHVPDRTKLGLCMTAM